MKAVLEIDQGEAFTITFADSPFTGSTLYACFNDHILKDNCEDIKPRSLENLGRMLHQAIRKGITELQIKVNP